MPRFDICRPRHGLRKSIEVEHAWYYLPIDGDPWVWIGINLKGGADNPPHGHVEISGRKLYRELKRIYEPKRKER